MSNNYFNLQKAMIAGMLLLFLNLTAQCIQPSNIYVGQYGTAHARVNWLTQQTQPALGYDWQVTLNGNTTVLQSGTVQNSSVLVTGLQPLTAYQLQVRSHCDATTYSDWTTQNFTTQNVTVQHDGTIGAGADANALFGSSYGPIMYAGVAQRNGSVANMLFTSAEMQSVNIPNGAQITGVAFDKVNGAYGGDSYPDLRMRMFARNSVEVAPLSTATTYGDIQGTHTEVMDNPAYDLPATIGWVDFNFDTPFTYNGGAFELATAMYQNGQTAQFSTYVIWQFTAGYKDYMIGAWPINTVPMSDALVLNHNSGSGQYKDRPNIKIYYAVSNLPVLIDVNTMGNVAPAITQNQATLQLTSSIAPSYVSQEVVWQVISGSQFATVSANGLVTPTGNGTVTVQAVSADNATLLDTIQIIITNQLDKVTSVEVSVANNADATITTDNGTLQLNALILPSTADQNVIWSITTGSELATVDANGLVTAVNNGTVTVQAVSAENNTILDTIEVIITNQIVAVASVEVSVANNAAATITTDNGTLLLNALVLPSNSNQNVIWSITTGSTLATVDANGLVTALDNGTITIQAVSAEDNTILDTIDVIITNQIVAAASLEISVENDIDAVITANGGTLQLIATVAPTNAEQDVTWSIVSGSEFVSIDADGLVTALSNGTAIIKAQSTENATISDTIAIVVTGQVLGVSDFNKDAFVIYPNPTQDVITIQSQAEIRQIAIYAVDGRKLLEGNGNTINIASLPQSNYILMATSADGKTISKKIVKK